MLSTSVYLIVFRVVHVIAAILWGGAVFLFVLFVQPSAAATAPGSGPFVRELLAKRRLVDVLLTLAATTIVGGGFLYWHDWQLTGSFGDWVGSTFGLWLTIGTVVAIAAFLIGLTITRPNVRRLLTLGGRVAQAGGEPTSEQAREMRATQARLRAAARTSFALIMVAAFTMATARYW
ncbi:MAG: hypothetical protein ACXWX6_10405 [Actinomycetota bacterium]